jgi:hypothetical protein
MTTDTPTLTPVPTIGRIVHYTLSEQDAAIVMRRRTTGESIAQRIANSQWAEGAQAHVGNDVKAGDVFPMLIVRTWGDTPGASVNGKVELDGTDVLWVTSRSVGTVPGTWAWPTRG